MKKESLKPDEGLVKLELRLTPDERRILKEWTMRAGFDTYSSCLRYLIKNMEMGTLFVSDVMSFEKWYQHMLNQLDRSVRVAARQEARLVLHEEGFVSGQWEK